MPSSPALIVPQFAAHWAAPGAELRGAEEAHRLAALFGPVLRICDGTEGRRGAGGGQPLEVVPTELVRSAIETRSVRVREFVSGLACFAAPFLADDNSVRACCGYVLTRTGSIPEEIEAAARHAGWSRARLEGHLVHVPVCGGNLLRRMLTPVEPSRDPLVNDDFVELAEQLNRSYEELSLLHGLTHKMRISSAPQEVAAACLARMVDALPAEGHFIWLNDDRGGPLYRASGGLQLDVLEMARLIGHFGQHDWSVPLVRNGCEAELRAAGLPALRNLVLSAIADGPRRFGWIGICNQPRGGLFGSMEGSLLSSVASILGTHQHNLELYRQHDDLVLGFVRSLVWVLDAKDPYTRGHSERVALIAQRLATQMNLPEDQVRDIHLSGLLHDLGKIGVDDQILRKPGPLTAEEFEHVKRHPAIGYNILAGLTSLQAALPGVRHHHESYSGGGYPDGLKGEDIPLMARVLAVADSYDAMVSSRPYRPGMKRSVLEQVFRADERGQWDPKVLAAYFAVSDEIAAIHARHIATDGQELRQSSAGLPPSDPGEQATRTINQVEQALAALNA